MYWIIVLCFGYALGTFMAAGWRPYAMCIPVSGLVFLVTNFLSKAQPGPDMPTMLYYLVGVMMYVPLIMLGVFLAQRKTKNDSFN